MSIDHHFWRQRRAKADLNWGPAYHCYQHNALPLGQTGSHSPHLHTPPPPLLPVPNIVISLMVSVDVNSVKHHVYLWERLRQLKLPTLKYRRYGGDLNQVFKIISEIDDLKFEDFITTTKLNSTTLSRPTWSACHPWGLCQGLPSWLVKPTGQALAEPSRTRVTIWSQKFPSYTFSTWHHTQSFLHGAVPRSCRELSFSVCV